MYRRDKLNIWYGFNQNNRAKRGMKDMWDYGAVISSAFTMLAFSIVLLTVAAIAATIIGIIYVKR